MIFQLLMVFSHDHALPWPRIRRAHSKSLMMMGNLFAFCYFKENVSNKVKYYMNRCPVDPAIFPAFSPDGNALQSLYEAFRFTESYGVIFQCNVKYCLGPCEPAVCEWGRDSVESWGRRRRSVGR